jgi:hypothetical protein
MGEPVLQERGGLLIKTGSRRGERFCLQTSFSGSGIKPASGVLFVSLQDKKTTGSAGK